MTTDRVLFAARPMFSSITSCLSCGHPFGTHRVCMIFHTIKSSVLRLSNDFTANGVTFTITSEFLSVLMLIHGTDAIHPVQDRSQAVARLADR